MGTTCYYVESSYVPSYPTDANDRCYAHNGIGQCVCEHIFILAQVGTVDRCLSVNPSMLLAGMGTYEEMECDMLMRMKDWKQISRKFPVPESPAVECAGMLALYQTGGMSRESLYQSVYVPRGSRSKSSVFNVGGNMLTVNFGSLTSAFMVSDMALMLDLPNVAQRAAFEAMEYIPNYNKSARSIKRLTETAMITGQYQLAKKYLSILEETLFYRKWAQSIRLLVEQPELIKEKPYYQQLKKAYAMSEDIFFI